jgi:hypothetical protein
MYPVNLAWMIHFPTNWSWTGGAVGEGVGAGALGVGVV